MARVTCINYDEWKDPRTKVEFLPAAVKLPDGGRAFRGVALVDEDTALEFYCFHPGFIVEGVDEELLEATGRARREKGAKAAVEAAKEHVRDLKEAARRKAQNPSINPEAIIALTRAQQAAADSATAE